MFNKFLKGVLIYSGISVSSCFLGTIYHDIDKNLVLRRMAKNNEEKIKEIFKLKKEEKEKEEIISKLHDQYLKDTYNFKLQKDSDENTMIIKTTIWPYYFFYGLFQLNENINYLTLKFIK